MNKVEYDKKKFSADAYGNLYPKKQKPQKKCKKDTGSLKTKGVMFSDAFENYMYPKR